MDSYEGREIKIIDQKVNPRYVQRNKSENDFGVALLEKNVKLGKYIQLGYNYPEIAEAMIYGYPGDKNLKLGYGKNMFKVFGMTGKIE